MRMLLDVSLGVWWLFQRVLQGGQGAWGALRGFVFEGYLIGWVVCISRVFFFGSNIDCFLLLLLAFRWSNGSSTEGDSQALTRIVLKLT